jgi:hypothetical protein
MVHDQEDRVTDQDSQLTGNLDATMERDGPSLVHLEADTLAMSGEQLGGMQENTLKETEGREVNPWKQLLRNL